LQFDAAVLTDIRETFVCCGCVDVFTTTAVQAFDHDKNWRRCLVFRTCDARTMIDANLHRYNRLAALNSITIVEKYFLHSSTVHKRAVRRAEVAKKRAGRIYFQQTVIAREESIVG